MEVVLTVAYFANLRRFSRNARLFLLSAAAAGLSNSVLLLFFNLYVLSQGYSKELLGLLQALPVAAGLLAVLPAALLGDRFGRKPALLLGSVVSGGAGLAFLLARAPLPMALAMVVAGLGGQFYLINIEPFLSESATDAERTALFSVNAGLVTLTGFAGNLLAGFLPGLLGRWLGVAPGSAEAYRAALLAGGVVGLLSFLPLLLLHETRRARADGPAPASFPFMLLGEEGRGIGGLVRAFRPSPTTLRLAVPNLLIGLGAALLIPYLNVFFRERYALPDNQLGGLFSLASVMTGLAILLGPVLAGRWGKVRSLAASQVTSVVFLLILGFVPLLWIAALAFWLRAALMNLGGPLYAAFAMEQTPPGERARVNAVLALAWGSGTAIGPYISGLVQMRWGFSPLFMATALLYTAAALWALAFFRDAEALRQPARASRRAVV